MIEHLDLLRRHGAWADAQLLAALKSSPGVPLVALRESAHVRGAQATWLARITDRQSSLPIWPELSVDDLERAGKEIDGALDALHVELRGEDLTRLVRYGNSRGDRFETPLCEVLLHVALHGQYHRAKANAALRDVGADPAPVDYIAWTRLGQP